MYTLFADLIFTRHYCGFLKAAGMDAFSLDRYLPLTFPVAWDEGFLMLHSLGLSGDDSLINPPRKAGGISYSGKSLRSHFCLYVNIFSSLSQLCDLLRREMKSLSYFTQPADQSISVPCGQFFQVYVRTLGLEGANGFDGVLPLVWLFSPSAGLLFSLWSVSTDDLLHNRTCS